MQHRTWDLMARLYTLQKPDTAHKPAPKTALLTELQIANNGYKWALDARAGSTSKCMPQQPSHNAAKQIMML